MSRKSTLITLAALAALTLAAGCGSSTRIPTAIDTAPPAAPTALTAAFETGGVVVTWAPNTTDADFAGFVVSRTVHGNVAQLIDTPTDITECVDPAPVAGCLNSYAVSARDLTGNESGLVTITVDLRTGPAPQQPADPSLPDGTQAEAPAPSPVGHPSERGLH